MNFFKKIVKNIAHSIGYKVERIDIYSYADGKKLGKAVKFIERFREVVSDPINLLINRIPEAGYVNSKGYVTLHNGNIVPLTGAHAYYSNFSEILIINRGVHEPLEEYCFQTLIEAMENDQPRMLELGSYWAHYSMWLLKKFPMAKCFMVEPAKLALESGRHNFKVNKYKGIFINEFVSRGGFQVDNFLVDQCLDELDILHSDIQGYELEMLEGAHNALANNKINYIFISTHSQELHNNILEKLKYYSYRIEITSNYDEHTTSSDGFIFASSEKKDRVFLGDHPLGRLEIAKSEPAKLVKSILSNLKFNKSSGLSIGELP